MPNQKAVPVNQQFLNPSELARYLGVPVGWIYDRTQQNGPETIPHSKLGKYLRFNLESEAFRQWLLNHEISSELTSKMPVLRLPNIEGKERAINERSINGSL